MSSKLQKAEIVVPAPDHEAWHDWHYNLMRSTTFMEVDARLDLTPNWQTFEVYRLMMKREMFYYDALMCEQLPEDQRS